MDPEIAMGEDCLYLNVWTNAKSADAKQPVLVWFFGGGLQCGYPAEMEFDGERIARRGIVVVTVNYRVGALGFLTHPEITAQQPDAPANFGNLDQQAGLRWVQRNIAAFGGDPEPVTIAGQAENEILLGEKEYFLMGDNAGSSEDSRFADIGNVSEDQITGRLWIRVSPAEQFGWIR